MTFCTSFSINNYLDNMELDSKRVIVTKLQQELVELRSIIAKSTS